MDLTVFTALTAKISKCMNKPVKFVEIGEKGHYDNTYKDFTSNDFTYNN